MLSELKARLGADRFCEGSETQAWAVDGVCPALVVFPESTEEVVEVVRAAAEAEWAIVPANGAGGAVMGNIPRACHLVVSLARMNRILEYEPADLTAGVQAGCTLSSFNQATCAHGQWLPFDPPGAERATLGGLAATDDFGALRTGHGRLRDYVIGMEAVLAHGAVVHSGGRVVKNVAGFDMNKLYLGSHGTLGIITQLHVKLRPQPPADASLLIGGPELQPLVELGRRIIQSELLPSSLEICNPDLWSALAVPQTGEMLRGGGLHGIAVRLLETQAGVEYECRRVTELAREVGLPVGRIDGKDSIDFWVRWNRTLTEDQAAIRVQLSCLPALGGELFQWGDRERPRDSTGSPISWTIACGNLRASLPLAPSAHGDAREDNRVAALAACLLQWRARAQEIGGHLTVESAPVTLKRVVETWGDVGPQFELMKRIKRRFDPHSIFSPGRFVQRL